MLAIPILTIDAGAGLPDVPRETAATAWSPVDPLSAARRFAALSYTRLHLADDGPRGLAGTGRDAAAELLRYSPLPVQAHVREPDERAISDLLELGAQWIVTGLSDLEGASRVVEIASSLPGRIIVDLEPGRPFRGDLRRSTRAFDLIAALEAQDLGGILIAAPNAGATPAPTTLALIAELVFASPWPVQVRCEPDSLQALRNLADRGVASALFTASTGNEAVDPRLIAEEFAV